jgi:hypothetical protein
MARLNSSYMLLLFSLLAFRNICFAAQTTEVSPVTIPYIPGTFYQCLPRKSCGFDTQLERTVYNESAIPIPSQHAAPWTNLPDKKEGKWWIVGGVGILILVTVVLAMFV